MKYIVYGLTDQHKGCFDRLSLFFANLPEDRN